MRRAASLKTDIDDEEQTGSFPLSYVPRPSFPRYEPGHSDPADSSLLEPPARVEIRLSGPYGGGEARYQEVAANAAVLMDVLLKAAAPLEERHTSRYGQRGAPGHLGPVALPTMPTLLQAAVVGSTSIDKPFLPHLWGGVLPNKFAVQHYWCEGIETISEDPDVPEAPLIFVSFSDTICLQSVSFDLTDDAQEYVSAESLDVELLRARRTAADVLPSGTHVCVTLEADPEEEDAEPTLVFGVTTSLRRAEFRAAHDRFFRMLRWSGCKRLCDRLAVIKE